jgi:hypothetical protein
MAIFNSYVKLPEGKSIQFYTMVKSLCTDDHPQDMGELSQVLTMAHALGPAFTPATCQYLDPRNPAATLGA